MVPLQIKAPSDDHEEGDYQFDVQEEDSFSDEDNNDIDEFSNN